MTYRFADCTLDPERHTLMRGGAEVPVEPLVFDFLLLLARHAGELVTRDRMVEAVWQGRIVSESAISACIAAARKAVGDDGKAQAIIRTVPRRGVQLVAEVATEDAGPDTSATTPPVQRIRYCKTPSGHALAYAVTGNGSPVMRFGPPLTSDLELEFAYGLESSCISSLAAQTRYLRFDHVGSGQSERAEPTLGFDAQAREALAAAEAAGFDRFGVASFSGGCHAAIHFAAAYPERVTRMAIVGGYVEGRTRRAGGDAQTDALRSMIAEGWAKPDSPFAAAFMTTYFPDGPAEAARAVLRQMQAACDPEVMLRDRDAINAASTADLLDKVRCPVLILHARDDAVHPLSQAQKLAAGLPDAELVVFETANHVPLHGGPCWDIYTRTLADFFSD